MPQNIHKPSYVLSDITDITGNLTQELNKVTDKIPSDKDVIEQVEKAAFVLENAAKKTSQRAVATTRALRDPDVQAALNKSIEECTLKSRLKIQFD